MSLPLSVVVGGNTPAATGTTPQVLRVDPTGALSYSKIHGDYYEAAVRKTVFSGSNISAVTTSAGFATTHTGYCLANPIGSTVNLVLNKVCLLYTSPSPRD